MRCPTCNVPLPETAMVCGNCRADLSFKAISPEGHRYGPYDCQSFRQYVQEGRIMEGWRVVFGDSDPMPLEQVMERVQFLSA